jgi:predicted metal-dependent hydrolase
MSQVPDRFALMNVEVVRSTRRRRTVELRPVPGGVRISIPATATREEEAKYVSSLLRRHERRQQAKSLDLTRRSERLAEQYGLRSPTSIRWVENQTTRWGSCTPSTGEIRISQAIASFPTWVVDYVIVHELAHLTYNGHGPRFWGLVNRYQLSERARGFLIAKGLEGASDVDHEPEAESENNPTIDLRDDLAETS